MHHILTSADKDIIIVFAGGSHTANVCTLLEKFGYKKIRVKNKKFCAAKKHNKSEPIALDVLSTAIGFSTE